MIKRYLREIKNDHKSQGEWKVCSGNTIIDYETQEKWKFSYQWQLIYVLKILKFLPCIQRVMSWNYDG